MSSYDFDNDRHNDAARRNYDAAMNGEGTRKGVHMYEKPHLWDEERPCDLRDTPTHNFIPAPEIETEGFSSYSLWGKISTIIGFSIFGLIMLVILYTMAFK